MSTHDELSSILLVSFFIAGIQLGTFIAGSMFRLHDPFCDDMTEIWKCNEHCIKIIYEVC